MHQGVGLRYNGSGTGHRGPDVGSLVVELCVGIREFVVPSIIKDPRSVV